MDGVTHLQVVSYVLKLGGPGITMRHESILFILSSSGIYSKRLPQRIKRVQTRGACCLRRSARDHKDSDRLEAKIPSPKLELLVSLLTLFSPCQFPTPSIPVVCRVFDRRFLTLLVLRRVPF